MNYFSAQSFYTYYELSANRVLTRTHIMNFLSVKSLHTYYELSVSRVLTNPRIRDSLSVQFLHTHIINSLSLESYTHTLWNICQFRHCTHIINCLSVDLLHTHTYVELSVSRFLTHTPLYCLTVQPLPIHTLWIVCQYISYTHSH
jgi:hypothetical protein